MPKKLDDQIKEALFQDRHTSEFEKQQAWTQLEQELFADKKHSLRKHKYIYHVASSIAALFALFVGLQTEPGAALLDKVKNRLEPEKTVQVAIEGSEVEENMTLQQEKPLSILSLPNENEQQNPQIRIAENPEKKIAEYILNIDEERYQMTETDKGKIIAPKTPLDENYPEVYMEITQLPDISAEMAIEQLGDTLGADYENVSPVSSVEHSKPAFMIQGIEGNDWDSEITKHYVLDNGLGGVFIFTQKLFLEQEEQHGSHFNSFFQEFKILDSPQ